MTMALLAVVGDPIAHSRSPDIHQHFAQQCGLSLRYERRRVSAGSLAEALSQLADDGALGVNVTLPLKQEAYPLATWVGEHGQQAGALNVLKRVGQQWHGNNVDGIGLVRDLVRQLGSLAGAQVLVLGAGGAARGVIPALHQATGRALHVSNRSLERLNQAADFFGDNVCITPWEQLHQLPPCDVLINATSASFSGSDLTLPPQLWQHCTLAYELAYGHDSFFLNQARQHNVRSCQGWGMLVEQAAESFHWWFGLRPNTSEWLQLP